METLSTKILKEVHNIREPYDRSKGQIKQINEKGGVNMKNINKELVNFIMEIARQSKYDNNEDAISEIFEEAKSLIDDYEDSINPMKTVEETLSWLRCDK